MGTAAGLSCQVQTPWGQLQACHVKCRGHFVPWCLELGSTRRWILAAEIRKKDLGPMPVKRGFVYILVSPDFRHLSLEKNGNSVLNFGPVTVHGHPLNRYGPRSFLAKSKMSRIRVQS